MAFYIFDKEQCEFLSSIIQCQAFPDFQMPHFSGQHKTSTPWNIWSFFYLRPLPLPHSPFSLELGLQQQDWGVCGRRGRQTGGRAPGATPLAHQECGPLSAFTGVKHQTVYCTYMLRKSKTLHFILYLSPNAKCPPYDFLRGPSERNGRSTVSL